MNWLTVIQKSGAAYEEILSFSVRLQNLLHMYICRTVCSVLDCVTRNENKQAHSHYNKAKKRNWTATTEEPVMRPMFTCDYPQREHECAQGLQRCHCYILMPLAHHSV